MSGIQVESGAVAPLPSATARGIAFQGRQKSQWYLSFQQLIAASATTRFCIANSRALSVRPISHGFPSASRDPIRSTIAAPKWISVSIACSMIDRSGALTTHTL